MITSAPEEGAVNKPLLSMLPLLADHVTVGSKAPTPVTFDVHWEVPPVLRMVGLQEAATDVMTGGVGGEVACTVTTAVACLLGSCKLVAMTFTWPADEGAVNRPASLMPPPLDDQVTAGLKDPVPCTGCNTL